MLLGVNGCSATSPSPLTVAPPPPPARPPPAVAPSAAPVPEAKSPLVQYQAAWLDAFTASRPARPIESVDRPAVSPPHSIWILRKRGPGRRRGVWVITSGVGFHERTDPLVPEAERRVELLARVPAFGPGVAAVLSALAERMTTPSTKNAVLKTYEAIELETAVSGLKYFDLLPGGELPVLDHRVTLYKILPLSKEEYERVRSDSGSQWAGADLADPASEGQALDRWAPALESSSPVKP